MAADEEEKKRKIATALKWLGGIAGVAIVSPVVFIALKGALGILALGVAAGAGFTMLKLAPVVSMKISNVAIKLMINEAKKNPIESMINDRIEKTKELEAADAAIVKFETVVLNYDDKTADFSKQFPAEAPRFLMIRDRMHLILELQKEKQAVARANLEDFCRQITKAEAIYAMAIEAQKVTSLSPPSQAQVYREIRKQVVFDTVRSELNKSFAQLNMALAKREEMQPELPGEVQEQKVLPAPTNVIDIKEVAAEKSATPVRSRRS